MDTTNQTTTSILPTTIPQTSVPRGEPTESRLDDALAEYMQRSDLGEKVDRAAFLEKHPEIRSELATFFRMADQLADAQLGQLLEGRKPRPLAESLAAISPLALPGDEPEPTATQTAATPKAAKAAIPVAKPVPAAAGAAATASPDKTKNKDKASQPAARSKRPRDRVEAVRERRSWGMWFSERLRETPGAAISAAIHGLVLVILGLMTLPLPTLEQLNIPILLQQNDDADEPEVEPIVELKQMDQEEAETEVVEAREALSESLDISSLNDAPAPAARTDLSDYGSQHALDVGSLIASSSKSGDGLGKGGLGKVKFFGQSTSGQKFVFVIDNSGSMDKGRFETALYELMIAVEQMQPRQMFYVLFFSDTAYPLFHPEPAMSYVPATTANKQKLGKWLKTVELCQRTNALEAMQKALALQPDVIYLLGDGAFTDKTGQFLAQLPGGPQIHVMGMEVSEKSAVGFKAIADKFKGTYKDVGVHPDAREFAKAHPKDYLRKRGPVWGLKLPE